MLQRGHSGFKRILAQLPIYARVRARLTAEEGEPRHGKLAKARRLKRFDSLTEAPQRNWILDTRERQVRSKGTFFAGYANYGEDVVDVAGQSCQSVGRIDSGPKHARVPFIRKPAEIPHLDGEGFSRRQRAQSVVKLINPDLIPFAYKLRGDVKIVERRPFNKRLRTQGCDQAFQSKQNVTRQLDGDEQSQTRGHVLMF